MSQRIPARHVVLAALLLFCASSALVFSQATVPGHGKPGVTKAAVTGSGGSSSTPFARVLAGTWTYRSFVNDRNVNTAFNDIQFGAGVLTIQSVDDGAFRGRLDFGPDQQLVLKGSITYGNPPTLRFQGVGDKSGSKDWVYDYQAYYVLEWPNGVDQRAAIVGSVIRTQPHSGGKAKAGVVASFVAVRQDGGDQKPSSLLRMRIDPLAYRPSPLSKPSVKLFSNASAIRLDERTLLDPQRLSVARAASSPLKPALVKSSAAGRLDVELVVDYLDSKIGDDPVHLRCYNQSLVGPTLRVKAGDTLYIMLKNQLPPEKDTGHENEHHGWNTTNLHFHGLHVPPQGTQEAESDNVLLEIGPGQTQKYKVRIGDDHVAGTFWYHAHKHGSTSAQVSGGMAGALIIERDDDVHNLDSVKEIKDAQEQILVFQQTPYLIKGGKGVIEIDPNPATALTELNKMFGPGTWHNSGRFTTANGQRLPVLNLKQGEVQRWRMIHSGFRENLLLRLVKDPKETAPIPAEIMFSEIAVDGLPLGQINTTNVVELFPGYRSDVLIQAPAAAGTYYLIDATAPAANTLFGTEDKDLSFVAKVVIGNEVSKPMRLPTPDKLVKHRLQSIDPAKVTGFQQAYYGITSQFLIGDQDPPPGQSLMGEEFSMTNPRILPLNATEQWTIGTRNFDDDHLGGPTHPFHIHVNPFEVVSIKDSAGRETLTRGPVWRDTIAMPPGYTITFLTRYADFTGSFVQHCHILDHEDQGMMQLIRIDDPNAKKGDAGAANRPGPRPLEAFKDVNGKSRRLDDYLGRPVVLVFSGGLGCVHCMSQLKAFAGREADFRKLGMAVVFVTPDSVSDLQSALPAAPFMVLSDPEFNGFRAFGSYDGAPLHSVILLDARGKTRWQKTGLTAFMDVDAVLGKATAVSLQGQANAPAPAAQGAAKKDNAIRQDLTANCQCTQASNLTRVRKNIDCVTDQELRNLEHAFKVLQDRSLQNPNDKTGYDYQVRIHGDPRVGPCKHNTELIWPWHRAFLFYFEELLRAADPNNPDTPTKDVTLCYWDWTKPPSGVGYPKAFENPNSPLFHAGRNQWDATNPFPLFTDADIGLGISDWYLFGGGSNGPGQLENVPHNNGHGNTGGDMCCTATSVKDPIFWAHHANLDRQWDLWQQRWKVNPGEQTTVLKGWPATATPAPIVQNFNDIRKQLGYDYCNSVAPQVIDLPLAAAIKQLKAEGVQPLSLTFHPRDLRPAPPPVRHTRAQVRITGVKPPRMTTYQARVFLHPADVAAKPNDPDFVQRYLATKFTLLALEGEHGKEVGPSQHPETIDLNLDVTQKYEELVRTLPAGTKLAVTFDFTTGYGSERKRVQYGQHGIEFGQARLVVNPRPPLLSPR